MVLLLVETNLYDMKIETIRLSTGMLNNINWIYDLDEPVPACSHYTVWYTTFILHKFYELHKFYKQ